MECEFCRRQRKNELVPTVRKKVVHRDYFCYRWPTRHNNGETEEDATSKIQIKETLQDDYKIQHALWAWELCN